MTPSLGHQVRNLFQLALSRTREFDADRGAAELTGDAEGLALALLKLERRIGSFWEDMFLPGRRIPEPSLLRTHPPAEIRVRRLRELTGPSRSWQFDEPARPRRFSRTSAPRFRPWGIYK